MEQNAGAVPVKAFHAVVRLVTVGSMRPAVSLRWTIFTRAYWDCGWLTHATTPSSESRWLGTALQIHAKGSQPAINCAWTLLLPCKRSEIFKTIGTWRAICSVAKLEPNKMTQWFDFTRAQVVGLYSLKYTYFNVLKTLYCCRTGVWSCTAAGHKPNEEIWKSKVALDPWARWCEGLSQGKSQW